MRCPVDNETLIMADRNGVEIDYCPKCRGVWLDRGELDKIIERAAGPLSAPPAPPAAAPVFHPEPRRDDHREPPREGRRRDRDDDDDDDHRYRKRRKDSFLKDLFDF